jgi:hypothetical protein
LSDAFDRWQRPLEAALQRLGVPAERAPRLAMLMIVGLEGSLIVARSREDASTIDAVADELRLVLDSAVANPRSSRRPRSVAGRGVTRSRAGAPS